LYDHGQRSSGELAHGYGGGGVEKARRFLGLLDRSEATWPKGEQADGACKSDWAVGRQPDE